MSTTVEYGIGIAPLPEGSAACAYCGQATGEDPERVEERQRIGRVVPAPGPGGPTRAEPAEGVYTFGLCDSCEFRHALAAEIVEVHRERLAALGSLHITAERMGQALDALAAVGALSDPQDVTAASELYRRSYGATRSLLDRLAWLGASAAWSYRFAPVTRLDARKDTCATTPDPDAPARRGEPWLYLDGEIVRDIRRAMGEHLRDRLPPRPWPTPSHSRWGGCVMCGVATATAKRPEDAWTEAPAGKYAGGHLCPPCAEAVADDPRPGIGVSALEASVLDYVDPDRLARRRSPHSPRLERLVAWADSGHRPTGKRWAHVGLKALTEQLFHGHW